MGKRELVLIAVFVVVGIVIYQVTAPPLQPGQEGFSFGRVIQNMRRGIQGRRARASAESARTEPVGADVTELRVSVPAADLTIIGEDRQDAVFSLTVSSNGMDDEDARRLIGRTTLKIDRPGGAMVARIDFPREGQQQAKLVARIPRRLIVRVEQKGGPVSVSDVAAVTIKGNRGEATVKNIAGEADVTQRGAALRLSGVASLRLNLINADAEIRDVLGVASIDATGAKVELSAIAGPLDVKSRNTDVRLRDAPGLKPPLRLDMQAGELEIAGLRTEARIDGRNTEIRVAIDKASPITIYNTGENITVTAPPGGYTLDAIATDGDVASEDGAVKVGGDDREHRAAGAVRGGGPTLTLRATRGRIELRKNAGSTDK